MTLSRRQFLQRAGGLVGAAALSTANLPTTWAKPAAAQLPTADPVLHLLNRISYGPRPEDIVRARQIGLSAYLEEQLNPASLDDSVMDALLAEIPILQLDRHAVYSLSDRYWRCYMALVKGMVARATHSKRQLFERVVEFWSDHFNVTIDDFQMDMIGYQRDVIRRHAFGQFSDLLLAVAQSPAMLRYLNNDSNEASHPNENYARELLELHTLGVDGGHYTETDVKEVARALTGWTLHDGTETGFYFNPEMHDSEAKTILGHQFPAGRGLEDGLHVISLLAQHPATARYLCHKLCVRFVSDQPPPTLVESAAAVWVANQGEIVPVLRHIFSAPEFYNAVGQKLRRPLDFYIGAVRSTGTEPREFWVAEQLLQQLAQVPFNWHPPDGYPDVAGAWMNTSSLLARWNTAMQLTHEAWSDPDAVLRNPKLLTRVGAVRTAGELVDGVAVQVFGAPLTAEARTPFLAYVTDGTGDPAAPATPEMLSNKLAMVWGLMLASPAYQWR